LILKLFLKPYWLFSNVIQHIKIKILAVIISIVFITFSVYGYQLKNWRQVYFTLAARFDLAQSLSHSNMFWDDLRNVSIFDSSLWDKSKVSENDNFWFIEPAIRGGLLYPSGKKEKSGYNIGLLNEVRYRNFLLKQTADIDSRYKYDKFYPAHRNRAMQGRIDEAYLQYDWKYGFLRLGRMNRNWGPFTDRSLVLSSYPYSYDAFEWEIHSSFFEFRHLFSAFNYKRSNWDTDNNSKINRYLTAHSLNILIGEWITLGITETVVFTRKEGLPDLQYVNPMSIYTVTNTNQEGDGNLMLGFQWKVYPFTKRLIFKGQIALDDFQVDNEKVTDQEPAHWGCDIGLFWLDPFNIPQRNLFRAEYSKRSEWLYTVTDANGKKGERYTYLGKSLGLPLIDGDKVSLGFDIIGHNFWAFSYELAYCRQGANTALTRWKDSEPGNEKGLPIETDYPYENRIETSLQALFYFKNYVDLKFEVAAGWIKNNDNIKTRSFEFSPLVDVSLTLHYSNFFVKLPH